MCAPHFPADCSYFRCLNEFFFRNILSFSLARSLLPLLNRRGSRSMISQFISFLLYRMQFFQFVTASTTSADSAVLNWTELHFRASAAPLRQPSSWSNWVDTYRLPLFLARVHGSNFPIDWNFQFSPLPHFFEIDHRIFISGYLLFFFKPPLPALWCN